MRVEVRLHGELKELLDTQGSMSLPDGSTLETLNDILGLSFKDIVVMLVNGVAVSGGTSLREGDRVDIFTPLSGG